MKPTPKSKEEEKDSLAPLKEAIVRAVPEIMELKFGCEIKVLFEGGNPLPVHKVIGINDDRTIRTETYGVLNLQDVVILGRPIRLADVLVAIKSDSVFVMVNGEGSAVFGYLLEDDVGYYRSDEMKNIKWNLRDDNLDHQSPETLQFLSSILGE